MLMTNTRTNIQVFSAVNQWFRNSEWGERVKQRQRTLDSRGQALTAEETRLKNNRQSLNGRVERLSAEFCGKVVSAIEARSIAVNSELSNLDIAQGQAKSKITNCRWVYRSVDRISKSRFWDIPTHAKQAAAPLVSNGQSEIVQGLLSNIESKATALEGISAELRTHRIPEDRSLRPEPKKAIDRPIPKEMSAGRRVLIIALVIGLAIIILTLISKAWPLIDIFSRTHWVDKQTGLM